MTPDPEAFSLPAVFSRRLGAHGERPAVVHGDEELDYATLDARSTAFAATLADRGVRPGDGVAVLMETRPEYLVADLGLIRAGAARVPVNHELGRDGVEYVLSDVGVGAVVCGPRHLDDVAALRESLPDLHTVVAVHEGDADALPDGVRSFEAHSTGDATPPAVEVDPADRAGVYYTGGTTGRPKGVEYSQRGLTLNLYAHLAEFGLSADDTAMVATPLSHSGGTFAWATLLAGGTVVLAEEFAPARALAAIERHGVTWTFMVPTMIYRLLDSDALGEYDVDSLERVVYGAAPMRPDRLRAAIDRFGPVFHQFYGQTEVPNLVTTLDRRDHREAVAAGRDDRLRSAGTPCVMVDVRVVDSAGSPVEPGEAGEVVVRSPYAFTGYAGRPEETAATLRDGWVYTGDVGRFDEDGYLTLLDRKDDVIVTGGLNVYSNAVERTLGEHPDVRDVAVIGVPDDDWGEAVTGFVVAATDSLDAADVLAFADERLAGYETPKHVEVVEELPETPIGKVDKRTLRERYWRDEDRSIH